MNDSSDNQEEEKVEHLPVRPPHPKLVKDHYMQTFTSKGKPMLKGWLHGVYLSYYSEPTETVIRWRCSNRLNFRAGNGCTAYLNTDLECKYILKEKMHHSCNLWRESAHGRHIYSKTYQSLGVKRREATLGPPSVKMEQLQVPESNPTFNHQSSIMSCLDCLRDNRPHSCSHYLSVAEDMQPRVEQGANSAKRSQPDGTLDLEQQVKNELNNSDWVSKSLLHSSHTMTPDFRDISGVSRKGSQQADTPSQSPSSSSVSDNDLGIAHQSFQFPKCMQSQQKNSPIADMSSVSPAQPRMSHSLHTGTMQSHTQAERQQTATALPTVGARTLKRKRVKIHYQDSSFEFKIVAAGGELTMKDSEWLLKRV